MKIARYQVEVAELPVDFFADPDGLWDFESLVEAAGFDVDRPGVCIGALSDEFRGHPPGSAVVTRMGESRYLAVVECDRWQTKQRAPELAKGYSPSPRGLAKGPRRPGPKGTGGARHAA